MNPVSGAVQFLDIQSRFCFFDRVTKPQLAFWCSRWLPQRFIAIEINRLQQKMVSTRVRLPRLPAKTRGFCCQALQNGSLSHSEILLLVCVLVQQSIGLGRAPFEPSKHAHLVCKTQKLSQQCLASRTPRSHENSHDGYSRQGTCTFGERD